MKLKSKHLSPDEEAVKVLKAVANKHRLEILRLLSVRPHNVNELAAKLNLPFSTTATNVKKLEDVELISTELVPGRGTQKVNAKNYDRIIVDLFEKETEINDKQFFIDMPIGEYFDCKVHPNCGLVGEKSYIGMQDDPRAFYEPGRKEAQLLFMRHGYVEYRFQNKIPYGTKAKEIEVAAELCSEAPNHKLDWPSDITVWINGKEAGTWTSPSDFGGERGFLTPSWWHTNYTQYGMLKRWRITSEGCFIDGNKITDKVTIKDLELEKHPFISIKIGVKDEAENKGGFNLFGPKFGNYEQGIQLTVET
ncbi:ArsR/SmtB family transcription factor [Salipaludibacillus aurantiacus]|uniref:ArsR/SmtB family transcription factor n=1 Tax=Salipaludibacillus aurantiacus TaxID=1601833 RepID=UPI000B8A3E84|nr:helix-turn-helix domain-containing protein [Salipaludibacillus aurantiacus]